jgi:hypothetical protein
VLSFASVHQVALRRGRPSVLSFASVHKVALHEGARPSVLSFASVHHVALHEEEVLLAIIRICSSCCVTRRARPSVHSHLFIICVEGHVLRAIIRICSSCCVTRRARPSVLSSSHLIIIVLPGISVVTGIACPLGIPCSHPGRPCSHPGVHCFWALNAVTQTLSLGHYVKFTRLI